MAVKWGVLTLKTLGLDIPAGSTAVTVTLDGQAVPASLKTVAGKRRVVCSEAIELKPGQVLTMRA